MAANRWVGVSYEAWIGNNEKKHFLGCFILLNDSLLSLLSPVLSPVENGLTLMITGVYGVEVMAVIAKVGKFSFARVCKLQRLKAAKTPKLLNQT